MRDEHDNDNDTARAAAPIVDNLRVFQPRLPKERPVLRQLTSEDLARINELVSEYGVG